MQKIAQLKTRSERSIVSEEGLSGNTMLWELRFKGLVAGKVSAADQQQRIAY